MADQFIPPVTEDLQINLGGEDPKPLSRLAKAIANKVGAYKIQQFNKLPTMAPGYVPMEDTKVDVAAADQEESMALKEAEPIIDQITTDIFGAQGEKINNYKKLNKAGNSYLSPEFKTQVQLLNERYGGDAHTLNLLETRVASKGEMYLVQEDIKNKAAKMFTSSPDIVRQDQAEAELNRMHSQRLSTLKVLTYKVKEDLLTTTSTLSQERDQILQGISDSMEYEYRMMAIQAKKQKEDEVLNNIFQTKGELADAVAQGQISKEDAQKQLDDYSSEQYEELTKYKDRYFRHDIREPFMQKHGNELQKAFDETVDSYSREIHSESNKAKEKMNRMLEEQNKLLRFDAQKYLKGVDANNFKVLGILYEEAATQVGKERQLKEMMHTASQYVNLKDPVNMGIGSFRVDRFAKLFGNQYASVFGGFIENIGKYLQSQGIDIDFTRMLSRRGYSLNKEFETFKPDISGDMVTEPGFIAQSLGGLAATTTATIGLTVLTRNPFIAGTVSGLMNTSSMAGEVTAEALKAGASPAEAIMQGDKFFSKNILVSTALEAVMSKVFKMAFRGEQGFKAVGIGAPTEYLQEVTENSLQDISINPAVDFSAAWLSAKNQKAGLEAAMGAGFLTGASSVVGRIFNKVPAPDGQWIASTIKRHGAPAAHMINEMDFHNGEITEEEFTKNREEINGIDKRFQDAKKAGLNDAQALLHVGFSLEADRKREKAAQIEDPVLQKAVLAEADTMESKAMDVVSGKIEVQEVDVAGIGTVAAETTVANEIENTFEEMPTVEAFQFEDEIKTNEEQSQEAVLIQDEPNQSAAVKEPADAGTDAAVEQPAMEQSADTGADATVGASAGDALSGDNEVTEAFSEAEPVAELVAEPVNDPASSPDTRNDPPKAALTSDRDQQVVEQYNRDYEKAMQEAPVRQTAKVKLNPVSRKEYIRQSKEENVGYANRSVAIKFVEQFVRAKGKNNVPAINGHQSKLKPEYDGEADQDFFWFELFTDDGTYDANIRVKDGKVDKAEIILFDSETQLPVEKVFNNKINIDESAQTTTGNNEEQNATDTNQGDAPAISGSRDQEVHATDQGEGTTGTVTQPDAEQTEQTERSRRERRNEFLTKVFDISNPSSDINVLTKLPAASKTKKLAAMTDKLIKAKQDNLVDFEEYDELSNRINRWYIELGEKTRVTPLSEMREEERAAMVAAKLDSLEKELNGEKPTKTTKKKAKDIAEKIKARRIKDDKLHESLLGIPVAIYNGMLVTAANIIEAGGTIAEAIESAVDYVREIVNSPLKNKYFDDDYTFHEGRVREQFEERMDDLMMGIAEEAVLDPTGMNNQKGQEAPITKKTSEKYKAALQQEYADAVVKLGKVKAQKGMVNIAGGIAYTAYNRGLEQAAKILQEGGTTLDAVDAMVSFIVKETGKTDAQVRPDVLAGFRKMKIRIRRAKTEGPTEVMSMMDMFKHRMQVEDNLSNVVSEILEEVSKYFRLNGIDMTKGRIATVIKTLTSLVSVDTDVELLFDTIDRLDAIVMAQSRQDKVDQTNAMIHKFRKMIRSAGHLTDSNFNRLSQLPFPSAEAVLIATGSIDVYHSTLQGLLEAYGPKQGRRSVSFEDTVKIADRMEEVINTVAALKQQRMEDKLELINKDRIKKGLPQIDIATYLINLMSEKKQADEQERTERQEQQDIEAMHYRQTLTLMQAELRVFLDSVQSNMMPQAVKTIREFAELDISTVEDSDLSRFNNILNNILLDGDITGADELLTSIVDKAKADQELASGKHGIKTRPVGRILGVFSTERMLAFNGLLEAMTFGTLQAATLRRIMFGKAEAGIARVQAIMEGTKKNPGVLKQFVKVVDAAKITKHDQHRLSVYAFLKQSTDQLEYDRRLEKLVAGSVEGLYLQSLRESRNSDKKPLREEALLTAEALKSMGLIANYRIDKNMLVVDRGTGKLDDIDTLLSGREMNVYQFARKEFDTVADQFEHAARSVYGMDVRMVANYFPMIARSFEPDTNAKDELEDALEIFDQDRSGLGVQPIDRMKKRGELAGPKRYYQMGFVDVFLNSYHQSLTAIHAGRGLKASAKIVNGSTFRSFIQGNLEGMTHRDNQRIFITKMKDIFQDLKNAPFLHRSMNQGIKSIFTVSINQVVKTFLSRMGQLVDQFAPNFAATLIEAGAIPTGLASTIQMEAMINMETNEDYNKFLSMFSGQFRSPLGMEIYDAHIKNFDTPAALRTAMGVLSLPNAAGEWALRTADKGVFHTTLLASYISYLYRKGKIKDFAEFNLKEHAANPDEGARSYAEQMAGRINNESNKAYRADVIKNKGGEAINYLYMLSSYSVNSFVGFYNSSRTYFSNKASGSERHHAFRNMAGYLAQIMVFNISKMYITNFFYEQIADKVLLEGILGYTLTDLTEEEERDAEVKRWTKIGMQAFSDIAFGGMPSLTRSLFQDGINWAYQQHMEKVREDGVDARKGSIYDPNFQPYFSQGTYGGGADMIYAGLKIGYEAFIKENKNTRLTEEANQGLDDMEYIAFIALALGSGDLFKISNAAKTELRKQTSGSSSGGIGTFNTNFNFRMPKF
jgi:hypothetical protein